MQMIYPWLQPLWLKWQDLSENDRVPGAMLCCASQGMGVNQLVERFSSTLVCTHSDAEPCGFCHSCSLVASGNHPDIHWIKPEKEGKAITVEQIRACNRKAVESSQLGGKRIIIITPAEAMNESASNALLKTLETPGRDCIFILLTHKKSRLLPTIVSRCQCWHLAEPDADVTYQWLKGQTEQPVDYCGIHLSKGVPLKALAFFSGGANQRFNDIQQELMDQLQASVPDFSVCWKLISEDTLLSLDWLATLLADVQKVHFGLKEKGRCERSDDMAELISYDIAYHHTNNLNQIHDQLVNYPGLNAELLVTNWLSELHEEICL
ncbi:DNA polymerase III subunit delta' [Vibrio albus]|jgi:DNA polymerase-3 subunit delta'|uniref:DNA polymerase III subunit delta' n=1 Tax=Vibrio albus TaxID=2200953 RepID=A0A2U3BE40_9VIBR|nr:DNA polymerase III subunit delta' [Vibrio albus]PWI34994.1 DNA polymerase III subunit delta' [Vibrio albus]